MNGRAVARAGSGNFAAGWCENDTLRVRNPFRRRVRFRRFAQAVLVLIAGASVAIAVPGWLWRHRQLARIDAERARFVTVARCDGFRQLVRVVDLNLVTALNSIATGAPRRPRRPARSRRLGKGPAGTVLDPRG